MIVRVLSKIGSTVQERWAMYKKMAQSLLLYVSESWVVTWDMCKVLEGFHHRAEWEMTGMTDKCEAGGECKYPLVVAEM